VPPDSAAQEYTDENDDQPISFGPISNPGFHLNAPARDEQSFREQLERGEPLGSALTLLLLASLGRGTGGDGGGSVHPELSNSDPAPLTAVTTPKNVSQTSASPTPKATADEAPDVTKVSTHFPKVSTHPKQSSASVLRFVPPKVSTHFSPAPGKKWKKSAKREGWLIKRIKGYDIAEDQYGVSYLYVVTRDPKKQTSADCTLYEHAGFFTWKALEVSGRLVPLEKQNDRTKRNVS
jgi:hypothetical protein